MKLGYTGRRIWGIVDTVIDWVLIIVLLISLYNVVQRKVFKSPLPMIGGYGYAVVLSGSMLPEIEVSDVVVIKEKSRYEVGDIITFIDQDSPSKALVTHRVIEVSKEGYKTKGDNNNAVDQGLVAPADIKGHVVKTIGFIGSTLLFIQKPVGTLCLILLALLFIELPYQLRTTYKKATEERIAELRTKIGPGSEKKKFTPDLFMEENDGSYRAPEKTKKQLDFEREIDWRRRRKQRRKIYVPEEKHWDISIDEDEK